MENTTSQIDTRTKVCHVCKAKAVVVEYNIYYCADCMLVKQGYRKGDKNNGSRKTRSK